MGLSSKLWSFVRKNICLLSEHSWDQKYFYRKNKMLLQCSYSCKFPASSIFSSADWRYPVEAESCTHPAKRDRCFPPPIAERQRLPNMGNFPHSAFARGPHSPAFEERIHLSASSTLDFATSSLVIKVGHGGPMSHTSHTKDTRRCQLYCS